MRFFSDLLNPVRNKYVESFRIVVYVAKDYFTVRPVYVSHFFIVQLSMAAWKLLGQIPIQLLILGEEL